MAPIKFEEHIKEKLEQRTITPSKNSWEKLSKQLDKTEERKSKKTVWWLGIAAGFIGVLLMVNLFHNTEEDSVKTEIVDTKTENSLPAKEHKSNQVIEDVNELKAVQEAVVNKESEKQNTVANHFQKTNKNPVKKISNQLIQEEVPVVQTNIKNENIALNTQVKYQPLKQQVVEFKSENNLASVEVQKQSIDDEVDALLEKAQQDILSVKILNDQEYAKADALLEDIENDIEEASFKGKLFNKIKSSYDVVKTTVADRNN